MTEKELARTIARINELSKKQKAGGLNAEEAKEQQELRQLYIESFRKNLKIQLENLDIKYVD